MQDMSPARKNRSQRRSADKRAILRDHYLFGKLTAQQIESLSACVVTRSVKRGTNIFAKGDPGTSLCAIGAGTVRISVPSVDGKDAVFNVLGKGAIFGEIALLDGNPRTADATAVTDCELFVIERRDFLPLIRAEPEIALRIEILCSKLRRTTEQAEEIMFLDLPSRLAKALMRLEAETACTGERKISITQRDLGNIIGMSRESINKQLRIWKGKKWVRLERNAVVILATDSLAAIGGLGAHSA
jgi:CRP/FNR family transcriptional regulator, cyclic AMP receptor protein